MKYHGCEIKKVKTDLGEEQEKYNFTYEIYFDGKYKNVALNLDSAKEYIDSGFNENYL